MNVRCLHLTLALIAALTVSSVAQENDNPIHDLFAAFAVDGMLFVSKSAETPFTLRIVGAYPRKTYAEEGQIFTSTSEREFQVTLVSIAKILPGVKRPADHEVLSSHAAWECKAHNELLHLEQMAKPEFLEVEGRTWCYWTYDLTALAERLRQDPKNPVPGPGPKTQQLLTTAIGKNILVLVSTTLNGQDDADTEKGLMNAAKTFLMHPQPLSQKELKDICSQKQQ